MIRMYPWGIIALFFALFALQCKSSRPAQQAAPSAVALDERLELIKMTDLKGRPFTLHKYGGKPVFLNFWATWCKPCIAEMESIQELQGTYKDQIVFLAVSNESMDKIREFKTSRNFSFEFARLDIEYIDAYVIKLPTTLLIDKEGKIKMDEEGVRVWTQYNNLEKVKSLLK